MSNSNITVSGAACTFALFFAPYQFALARPSGYSSAVCDPSSVDICEMDMYGTSWVCDLGAVADGSSGASIHVISDTTGTICETGSTPQDFCAWGVDGNGDAFYCEETNWAITTVRVMGTDPTSGTAGDDIYLQYDESSVGYDLDDLHAGGTVGLVIAGDGDDKIVGSRAATATYLDDLRGEEGQDEIEGHAGDDIISGGAHADTIDGGGGADTIYGNDGDDIIDGSAGDDHIYGGSGDDSLLGGDDDDKVYGELGDDGISGGQHNDQLWGGTGDDHICGDLGDDLLDGQQDVDLLWGHEAGDWKDGGPGNDSCDLALGTNVNCPNNLAARPANCP